MFHFHVEVGFGKAETRCPFKGFQAGLVQLFG
jgi:hypothetical protein